jgi:hypothetical protein
LRAVSPKCFLVRFLLLNTRCCCNAPAPPQSGAPVRTERTPPPASCAASRTVARLEAC